MVRHARMNGRPTLWLPGLDHASIAAQVVLDRILDREGETRASLGRERYLERMWAFVDDDPRHDPAPEPALRLVARLAAPAVHDGRDERDGRSGPRSRGCTRTAWPTGPRPWPTGASAARRRSATSRSCPTPETGHALDDPLPPRRRRRRRPARSLDRDRHDPSRDAPRRCRRRGSSRRPALRRAGRRDGS